jgi:glucokinase
MIVLYGDIGGTKTLLQLAEVTPDNLSIIAEQRYLSQDYTEFDSVVSHFLKEYCAHNTNKIDAACFGVAGPVIEAADGQQASITNLPWLMDSTRLEQKYQIAKVKLINDFVAVGYGIEALSAADFETLQTGKPIDNTNKLIIGAGTGLGVAQLIWHDSGYQIIATEGGHADFAPANISQLQLSQYLIEHYGRSAMEFVLSGPGLTNVYSFLAQKNDQLETEQFKRIINSEDPATAIAQAAENSDDPTATAAMDLFVSSYGAQAGNFALGSLALGGVYIAGGIAPKIIHHLHKGAFIKSFSAKGKMASLMEKIPVQVVMNSNVGLLGSQVVAIKMLNQQ